jgi:hypothetical protein
MAKRCSAQKQKTDEQLRLHKNCVDKETNIQDITAAIF